MAFLFYISCLFCCVLLSIIIYLMLRYNQENKLLQKKIGELKESIGKESGNQKDIIFRNMHDHVNPMLRFVMRNIEHHRISLKENKLTPQEFEQDIDVLLTALNDIRSCTHGEIPDSLKELGYVGSLEQMLDRIESHNIESSFENISSFGKDIPFDKLRELDLYRISSELVENIIKHSKCSRLQVSIAETEQQMVVRFLHDGNGLTNEKAEKFMKINKGTGLQSCKARARLLNAEIDYSQMQEINSVKLTVPFQWKTA